MTKHTPDQIFMDQTSHFPIQSSRRHKYIVICYMADSNAILPAPIKNRTTPELLQAYQTFYMTLTKAGFAPWLHKLDNKSLNEIEDFITNHNAAIQYVPPNNHCTNAAEHAIQTQKNHFKARLAPLPKDFPWSIGAS